MKGLLHIAYHRGGFNPINISSEKKEMVKRKTSWESRLTGRPNVKGLPMAQKTLRGPECKLRGNRAG